MTRLCKMGRGLLEPLPRMKSRQDVLRLVTETSIRCQCLLPAVAKC